MLRAWELPTVPQLWGRKIFPPSRNPKGSYRLWGWASVQVAARAREVENSEKLSLQRLFA